MPSPDDCPTCGRSSAKFGQAVKDAFAGWLKDRQAAIATDDAADAAARGKREKAAAKADAAGAAWGQKWEGHSHTYGDPVKGLLTCTACGFACPLEAVDIREPAQPPAAGFQHQGGAAGVPTPLGDHTTDLDTPSFSRVVDIGDD